jgi:hypothetical protein
MSVRISYKGGDSYKVPSASATSVRALVASELVDEHTVVTVVVIRALAAGSRAGSHRRAVSLVDVLEGAVLISKSDRQRHTTGVSTGLRR